MNGCRCNEPTEIAADRVPVRSVLTADEVAYIVDALLDAADNRKQRGGRLHEAIGDTLEDLAIRLYDHRGEALDVEVQR